MRILVSSSKILNETKDLLELTLVGNKNKIYLLFILSIEPLMKKIDN
jgi:hypothetical protein